MRKRGTSKHYVYTMPSRKAIQAVKDKVAVKTYRATQNQDLAALLQSVNKTLAGWANYFRHGVSKAVFNAVDPTHGTASCAGCGASTKDAPGSGCRNSGGASASPAPGYSQPTESGSPARQPCRSPATATAGADTHSVGTPAGDSQRLSPAAKTRREPGAWRHARRVRRADRGNPPGATPAGRPGPTQLAICLLAYIFLAVAAALQRAHDAGAGVLGLIPVTVPELLRQLRGTVIAEPRRDQAHRDAWSLGDAATSTAPGSSPALACLRRAAHDNDLQLPVRRDKPARRRRWKSSTLKG